MTKEDRRWHFTKHHNHNRSKGGCDCKENVFRLHDKWHNLWHELFGNRQFSEVAKLLLRAERMKGRCRHERRTVCKIRDAVAGFG